MSRIPHDLRRTFADDDRQFAFELALGAAGRGAADVGEVLATTARIGRGDADVWLHEWCATAGAAWTAANDAEAAGHEVSALAAFRRAETYYATALALITSTSEPERELDLWRRQHECWTRGAALAGGEAIDVPYEGTLLPAWFFPAPGAAGRPRPVVVMNNGSDGATGTMWTAGGAAARERGYHWLTFHGPGQQSTWFERRIPFRPDWETVLTPVTDALLARDDVDPERLAVIGISQGGFWVPRALAFEHRYAVAVADPGVVDVSASWIEPLPRALRGQLERGDATGFDREMHLAELFSASTRATLAARGAPYGMQTDSRYALYTAVARYRLDGEARRIATPLLVTAPEDEQFWPGQSERLRAAVPDGTLVPFRAENGADRHCEPLASATRDAAIFDWLDERLAHPNTNDGGAS